MIWIGRDKVVRPVVGREWVKLLYYGSTLIWQGLMSCFGIGYWRNKKAWLNNESWRNNK